jgi:putative spermidine/putrescine transport system permease protein
VIKILSFAFTDHTTALGGTTSLGGPFGNLEWFFGDSVQVSVLTRTLMTSAIVTAICLVVGYPYAYLMTIARRRARMLLLGVTIVSCWQSILARNYAWRILLRPYGVINDAAVAVGLPRLQLLGSTTAVIIGMCQVMIPFMILPLYAAFRNIDRRLMLAASSLGASPGAAFVEVFLPLSLPGVVAGGVLVFIISLGFYITPALLGSPQNAMLSQAIDLQIDPVLNWGHAGAMALVLLVATFVVLGVGAVALRSRLARSVGGTGAA